MLVLLLLSSSMDDTAFKDAAAGEEAVAVSLATLDAEADEAVKVMVKQSASCSTILWLSFRFFSISLIWRAPSLKRLT